MLNIVGPPMVGATELKSQTDKLQEKDFKGSGADSGFKNALQDKINLRSPKETKESTKQEARAKDSNDSRESKDEKAQVKDAKPERKVRTDDGKEKRAANRQQAIKEFMDSFESEFDIPPTRLVEAMAELDDSQLKQSPEVTANAVIDQLNLDDDQADKAAAMYAALLAQLQQMPQAQQPKPMPEMSAGLGMSQQSMQMRALAAQEKQTQLGAAADNVSKKFWMKQESPMMTTAMPDLNGDLASRMMMDDSALQPEAAPVGMMSAMETAPAPEAMNQQNLLDKLPPHLQGQMKETMSPALLAALAAKQAAAAAQKAEGAVAEDSSSELTNEFTKALEAPTMEKPQQADLMNKAVAAKTSPESFFQQQGQEQSMMQNSGNEFMQQGAQGKEAAKDKLTTKAAEFKAEMTGLEGLHGAPIKGESLKFDPALVGAPATQAPTNPAENEANVKQLMNQAQYLIKKGGGEVKVQMTPEGMGTIHLKVMLQDGKVNLQMQADSQEAKKSIESSLVDLKNSLAAHKLSVENVKVDVVNNTSADTATQNQNNNSNGQGREARQFWNNFNDSFGNQGRRESFTDMQPLRGYAGRRRDPLQPIDGASVKAAPRAVDGKGSGLNLVA
ncbi:flagellar hook-length control protein FliK [Bdellovibrio sp. HCB209]|uniref:flagellar hook-length control protein FliK n=1 Tax=Bdellovibrio sp. HCB209 TaxID=3394354 RepID=UPI0039B3CB91